jgi:predicted small integral membrane protein
MVNLLGIVVLQNVSIVEINFTFLEWLLSMEGIALSVQLVYH